MVGFTYLARLLSALLLVSLALSPRDTAAAGDKVPKEVRDMAGTYTGSWTMYGIDKKGKVVALMAWTDTMKAENPQVKDGRAFVTTTDAMKFEGGKIPPSTIPGKEGYFLKQDGRLGDYYVETFGQINRMIKLADNVWSYAAPAPDLAFLGFPKGASGQHVVVKVMGKEEGVETHRISRVTTVSWTDGEGKQRSLQFVSLQGVHKRQPPK
jgi:hypothetical protein